MDLKIILHRFFFVLLKKKNVFDPYLPEVDVLALYERPLKRLLNYELKNLMLYEITIQNKEITSFGNLVVWFVCCNMGTKLSLNYTNVELQDVLLSIKKQTGYVLVFSDQILDVHRRVSIKVEEERFGQCVEGVIK